MPVITFKVSEAEALRIRERARAERAPSISAYIRRAILDEPLANPKIIRRRHPVSGLPYNAGGKRIATDAHIREALAEFP